MEHPAGVAGKPLEDLGMLVAAVVVEDHVDHLAGRDRALDGVENAQELLMPVALHATPEHRAVEHIEGGEQVGDAVAEVVGSGCLVGDVWNTGSSGCSRACCA